MEPPLPPCMVLTMVFVVGDGVSQDVTVWADVAATREARVKRVEKCIVV